MQRLLRLVKTIEGKRVGQIVDVDKDGFALGVDEASRLKYPIANDTDRHAIGVGMNQRAMFVITKKEGEVGRFHRLDSNSLVVSVKRVFHELAQHLVVQRLVVETVERDGSVHLVEYLLYGHCGVSSG
jgi:hypothetical protein